MSTRRGNEGVNVSVKTLSSNRTLGVEDLGSVYILSSSDGTAITGTLPTPSQCAGSRVTFRLASADAAVVTGSGDTATYVNAYDDGTQSGGHFLIAGTSGNSIVVESDGLKYLVTAVNGSGSFV